MKKFLTLVVGTLLIGTMLVGCGNGNVSTNPSEKNSEKNENIKIEYNEIEIGYIVVNEADKDTSLVDGNEIKLELTDTKEYDVILKESVDLYDVNKAKVGYTKENLVCCYAEVTEEWCVIGNTDYTEIYYAKTDEILLVAEAYENPTRNYMDMGIWTRDLTVKIPDDAERILNQNKFEHVAQRMIQITESIDVYNDYGIKCGTLHTGVEFRLYSYTEEWACIWVTNEPPIYVKAKELQSVIADGYEKLNLLNPEGISETEMYAFVRAALDKAGLIYDESAFANVDVSTFSNDYTPNGYGFLSCSFPVATREETEPAFIEFIKMHSGRQYIIKSVEIREGTPNEGPGMFYIFNLYLKF